MKAINLNPNFHGKVKSGRAGRVVGHTSFSINKIQYFIRPDFAARLFINKKSRALFMIGPTSKLKVGPG